MSFFTRPDLSDIQFKQLTGSTLTMSGTTNFSGTLKSKNIEIDAAITGASSGDVLTYVGAGKIKLTPAGSGVANFDSSRATTRSGIPAVNVGGSTVNQFLEGYFFPSVPPTVSMSGGGTRQFGNNAGLTLNWTVTRRTNPLTSITVNGSSVDPTAFTGLSQNSSVSSGTSATIAVPNTNQTYNMNATTSSENVPASTSVNFSHKRFFYGDNVNLIGDTDANITANVLLHEVGSESEFSGTRVKSSFAKTLSSQFFYYVIPSSFGSPSFTINGLANTDFSSQSFTFTNSNGFATTFVIWRTNNLLTGNFTFSVS